MLRDDVQVIIEGPNKLIWHPCRIHRSFVTVFLTSSCWESILYNLHIHSIGRKTLVTTVESESPTSRSWISPLNFSAIALVGRHVCRINFSFFLAVKAQEMSWKLSTMTILYVSFKMQCTHNKPDSSRRSQYPGRHGEQGRELQSVVAARLSFLSLPAQQVEWPFCYWYFLTY